MGWGNLAECRTGGVSLGESARLRWMTKHTRSAARMGHPVNVWRSAGFIRCQASNGQCQTAGASVVPCFGSCVPARLPVHLPRGAIGLAIVVRGQGARRGPRLA